MKKIYQNPKRRALITGILTTLVSISMAFLGTWDFKQDYFVLKATSFLFLSILNVLHLVLGAAQDVKEKRIIDEYNKQINACEQALAGIIQISQTNASDLNEYIHQFKEVERTPTNFWSYKKVCYQLCQTVYRIVCDFSKSNDCEIAYVRLNESIDGEISMFAYTNHTNQPPNILNRKRNFKDKLQARYYDMMLFNEPISETKVLYGSDAINTYFHRTPEERKNNPKKYNQFIAIPIFCDNQKMVGLLEIACLNKCSLGNSEMEIIDIANRYFVPYANLFLLMHKIEKVLHLCID